MPSVTQPPLSGMVRVAACLVGAGLLLSGCDRDEAASLRTALSDYFVIRDEIYFESKSRCTAAVYTLTSARPRSKLPVMSDLGDAQARFRDTGLAAVQLKTNSPNDIGDALLLREDGALGKELLESAIFVEKCTDIEHQAMFMQALTGKNNLIGYSQDLEGFFVVDQAQKRLLYAAGEVI